MSKGSSVLGCASHRTFASKNRKMIQKKKRENKKKREIMKRCEDYRNPGGGGTDDLGIDVVGGVVSRSVVFPHPLD